MRMRRWQHANASFRMNVSKKTAGSLKLGMHCILASWDSYPLHALIFFAKRDPSLILCNWAALFFAMQAIRHSVNIGPIQETSAVDVGVRLVV